MEAQKADSVTDKQYYSGRWFEEFVYIFLKRELGLNKEQIALNMKLSRKDDHKQHDNEYDVVFTMNNALYVIECKASLGSEKTLKAKIEKSLYKLGAVTRDFGLRVNSYIFTLSHINITGKVSYLNIQKRKEILGIKEIFDAPYFYNINEIINHFKQ
jgi:hypothetical protein